MFRIPRSFVALAGLAALAACTDQAPAPVGLGLSASRSGVPFTEGLASPAWQARAATLVAQAGFNPQTATHGYPLLSVAQYVAVQRAEAQGLGGRAQFEADRGAVAGASAVVLTYIFPSQAQALEDLVTTQ